MYWSESLKNKITNLCSHLGVDIDISESIGYCNISKNTVPIGTIRFFGKLITKDPPTLNKIYNVNCWIKKVYRKYRESSSIAVKEYIWCSNEDKGLYDYFLENKSVFVNAHISENEDDIVEFFERNISLCLNADKLEKVIDKIASFEEDFK